MIDAVYTVWCDYVDDDGTPCPEWAGQGTKDEAVDEARNAGWVVRSGYRRSRDYCPVHTITEQTPTKPDYRGVWLGAYGSGTVKHFYLSAPTAHFGKISACGMGAANTVDVPRGDVRKCVGCLKVLTGKRPIAKAAYV